MFKSGIKLVLLQVVLITTALTIGMIIVMAQKENTEKTITDLVRGIPEDNTLFRKKSSSKESKSDGNRIVAVRRIIQTNRDFDKKRGYFQNKIPMVEIELYSKYEPQETNALNVIAQIGDFMDFVRGTSGDGRTLFVVLSQEDFDSLIDGSIISCFLSPGIIPRERLREQYKNGEPAEVVGEKYGRLDKKMIDRFPAIEEDVVTGNERRIKTKNSPE